MLQFVEERLAGQVRHIAGQVAGHLAAVEDIVQAVPNGKSISVCYQSIFR